MKEFAFEDMREGQEARRAYRIAPEVYAGFLRTFGDLNPLHTDDAYAASKKFPRRVMHGAILNGFLSHFIGMEFPGKYSLIQSVAIDYKNPCFLGDEIAVRATVAQKVEAVRAVVLKLILQNETRRETAARARVQVGML